MLRVVFSLFCSALLLASCGFFFEMSKNYTPPYNPGGDFFDEDEDFARSYEIYKKRREDASGGSAQQESRQDTSVMGGLLRRKPRRSFGSGNRRNDVIKKLREYGAVPVDKVERKGGMVNSEGVDLSEVRGARFLDFDLALKDEKDQEKDKASEREKPPKPPVIFSKKEAARRGVKSHKHAVSSPEFPSVASPEVSDDSKKDIPLFGEELQSEGSPSAKEGGFDSVDLGTSLHGASKPGELFGPSLDGISRELSVEGDESGSADEAGVIPPSVALGPILEPGSAELPLGGGSDNKSSMEEKGGLDIADEPDVPSSDASKSGEFESLFGGSDQSPWGKGAESADKPDVPLSDAPKSGELETLFGEDGQEPFVWEKKPESGAGTDVPSSDVPGPGEVDSLFAEGDRTPSVEGEGGIGTPGTVEIPLSGDVPEPKFDSSFDVGDGAGMQPVAPESTRVRAPIGNVPTVEVEFPSLMKKGADSAGAAPPADAAGGDSDSLPVSGVPSEEKEKSASEVSEASAGIDSGAPARSSTRRKRDGRRAIPRTSGRTQHPAAAQKDSESGDYEFGEETGDSVYDDPNFVDSWRIDSDYEDDYILQYMD
ncbi:MAG: TRP75-related protein [Anaplasma sp.]